MTTEVLLESLRPALADRKGCRRQAKRAGQSTVSLSPEYPPADAVTAAGPMAIPVTCGCVAGVGKPGAQDTVVGDTVSSVGLLLMSVTVTPSTGPGDDNRTPNGEGLAGRDGQTFGHGNAPKQDYEYSLSATGIAGRTGGKGNRNQTDACDREVLTVVP